MSTFILVLDYEVRPDGDHVVCRGIVPPNAPMPAMRRDIPVTRNLVELKPGQSVSVDMFRTAPPP